MGLTNAQIILPSPQPRRLSLMHECKSCKRKVDRDLIFIECAVCGSLCEDCLCTCGALTFLEIYAEAEVDFEAASGHSIEYCLAQDGVVVAIEDDSSNLEWIGGATELLLPKGAILQGVLLHQLPPEITNSHRYILTEAVREMQPTTYMGSTPAHLWNVTIVPFCVRDRAFVVSVFES